jgi:glycosyltransferase involved in cell wall biosynthesis
MPVLQALRVLGGVSLLVIGDGPERKRCERFAHAGGMSNRVTFCGWLGSHEEVICALQTAYACIVNSASEGGPRVALEAMALGMPVLATRVGILPEVISDGVNGVFTDGSAEGLKRDIPKLLCNAALQASIGAEARHILTKFDKTKLVHEYAKFLQSCS